MQVVPTVNIVMSYDPEVMIKFQEMGSLEAFKIYKDQQEAFRLQAQLGLNLIGSTITSNPQTYIFNNAPGSTFISLNHSVGGEASDALVEIELMDPQGVFEQAMLDNTVEGILDIKSNPVGRNLLKKKNDLVFQESLRTKLKKEERRLNNIDGSAEKLKKLANELAAVEDKIGEEETLFSKGTGLQGEVEAGEAINENDAAIEILNKQLATATTQFQRPIYITYGCGDDLIDWAPVHCYGRIIGVDYSFAGPEPRTLKLKFAGISAHPNAVQGMGVKPFGSLFTKGLVTKGESYRIFNKDAAKAYADKYKEIYKANNQVEGVSPDIDTDAYAEEDIDYYLGRPNRPSFHKVVKDAITQFIKNGTNYDNVLVCFPDLDKHLKKYLEDCVNSASWRAPDWIKRDTTIDVDFEVDYLKGFGEALEGIGMKLCQTTESSMNPGVHSSNGPVGENTFENLEECECVEDVGDWFESKNIKAVMECDYVSQTFLEKLSAVGKAIQNKIEEFAPDDSPPKMDFLTQVKGETDFELLRIMHRSGLINTPAEPLLYWGDNVFINNFLEARMLEYSSQQMAQEFGLDTSENLKDKEPTLSQDNIEWFTETKMVQTVHPLDVIDGLDIGYMKNVIDLVYPIPWIGPFGPMNSGDLEEALALTEDTNLESNSLASLKKNQPLKSSRMPVFTFGVKNPNVLGVDIDIDGIYFAAMSTGAAGSLPGQAKVAGIVPKDFAGTYTAMFQKMANLDLADKDKDNVPKGFWKLIEPYYDADWWNGDDVQDFDEWNTIFNSLGEKDFVDIKDMTFEGDAQKDKFKIFMWKAFSALFTQPDPIPLSTKNMPGNAPSKPFITHSMKVADRITNSAMTGRVTTLPLFNLASMRRVMNRACLLYCVEPQFTKAVSESGSINKPSTWFSGIYNLFSFKHTISADTVESEFLIVKGAGKGAALIKEDKEVYET